MEVHQAGTEAVLSEAQGQILENLKEMLKHYYLAVMQWRVINLSPKISCCMLHFFTLSSTSYLGCHPLLCFH